MPHKLTKEQRFRKDISDFWRNVHVVPESCWDWLACLDGCGYGDWRRQGFRRAHRFSWWLHNGPIPHNLWVLHKCDNPGCVRPDHLFLGTPKDNTRDMISKGREADQKGEKHWGVKLNADKVREIRLLFSKFRNGEIAARYGVDAKTIYDIRHGNNWAGVV